MQPGAWLPRRGQQLLSFDYSGGCCWAGGCWHGGRGAALHGQADETGCEMPCQGAGTEPWRFRSQRIGFSWVSQLNKSLAAAHKRPLRIRQ